MSAILSQSTAIACYHCGEHCANGGLQLEDKNFCCSGCRLIYEILRDNQLDRYYKLNTAPGISAEDKAGEYDFLDSPAIKEKIIDYAEGDQLRAHFHLPQIHCSSCIWLLDNLYRIDPGIVSTHVQFLKKELHIVFDQTLISLRGVAEVLSKIGYPPDISLQRLQKHHHQGPNRSLVYQLGLTGFVFGNVMLFSFPEYFGLAESEWFFQRLFGYLNLFFGLILLVFCASHYFRSAWNGLKIRELNIDVPIALGILSIFGRSAYEILSQTGAGYIDALAGLLFFLLLGKWFQQKTYGALSFELDYKSYFPLGARLITGEKEVSVPVTELKRGDTIVVRHGELIPADSILIKGTGAIDYSFVTGESNEVTKMPGDRLYAGGRQQGAMLTLRLTKSVAQSYLVQLWNENAFTKDAANPNLKKITRFVGRYFTAGILMIAFTTLIYWLPTDQAIAINAFSAVLIIACPCAIALTIPFSYGNLLRLMARHGFYLRDVGVIEVLQQVNSVVFDKTGTLTERNLGRLGWQGRSLDFKMQQLLASLVNESAHPRSRQIFEKLGIRQLLPVFNYREFPGRGLEAYIEGHHMKLGRSDWLGLEKHSAGTHCWIDGQVWGYFTHQSVLRNGLTQLVDSLVKHYRLSLLSGDNDLDRSRFSQLFGAQSPLLFGQQPRDKMRYIERLQQRGEVVMMIGDGLNDAGAIRQADAGIVLSEHTANFTPASDAVLAAAQLPQLPRFLCLARYSLYVVYLSYSIALLYNIIGLSFAVTGSLSPVIAAILMPLSSITIAITGVLGTWIVYQQIGFGPAIRLPDP